MTTVKKGLFGLSDNPFDWNNWPVTMPAIPAVGSHSASGPSAPSLTAAVGDLGTIAALSRGGSGGSSGTSFTTTSPPAATQVTTPGSGLVINLDWDSSVSSAPAGFTSDMIAAARFLESQISTSVTINLDVGYNEVAGSSLASGALGESETNIESVSYSALIAALKATASSDATDQSVLASLPSSSPANGTYWVTTAQAKSLGLSAANGTGLDGDVGFGVSSEFTYGDTNTSGSVGAGTYDFFATAVHELSETMGRLLLVGGSVAGTTGYSLMDLLHYSASGVRDFTQSTPGYFSVNGGATNLGNYNTIAGGDAGDWANSVTDNSFDAYATPGVLEPVTTNDLTEMDGISWTLNGSSTAPPPPPPASPPTVTDQTATQTWTERQTITLTLPTNTFTDPQGETLTYSASQANGQVLPSWLTFNAKTETFSGTAPNTVESLSIKVTATDTSNLSVSESFAANVVAPVVKLHVALTNQTPNQSWTDGQAVDLILPANTFTDTQGLKMTFAAYDVSGTNVTSWLHFNGTTDTFTGLVPVNEAGSTLLEVIAKDSAGASATDLFTVSFVLPGTTQHAAPAKLLAAMGPELSVAPGFLRSIMLHS